MNITKKGCVLSCLLFLGSFVLNSIPTFAMPGSVLSEGVTETELATVVTNYDSSVARFTLLVDSVGSVTGFRYYISADNFREVPLSKLERSGVLVRQQGYDILKLQGKDFDPNRGGVVKLIYIHNGLLNNYDRFSMNLVHEADGWFLVSSEGEKFNRLLMKMYKPNGQVLGVNSISGSWVDSLE